MLIAEPIDPSKQADHDRMLAQMRDGTFKYQTAPEQSVKAVSESELTQRERPASVAAPTESSGSKSLAASTGKQYYGALDDLFGDAGYEAFLTGKFGNGPEGIVSYLNTALGPKIGLKPPVMAAQATTDPTQNLTDQQKADGSYGKRGLLNTNLSDLDSVSEMAKAGGWADPRAFNVDMLDMSKIANQYENSGGGEGGDPRLARGTGYFKPEFAAARGKGGDTFTVMYGSPEVTGHTTSGAHWDNEGGTQTPTYGAAPVTGYQVKAGAVDGEKRRTTLYHNYDKDGKFLNTSVDVEETFGDTLKQIAPFALAMIPGLGPAALGGSINAGLGLGLGSVGQAALGGAALGGGTAALTGGNIGKGMLLGGFGGGLTALNPAAQIGIDKALQPAVNGAIVGGTKAALTGQDLAEGALSGGISAGVNGLMRGLFPSKGKS